LPTNPWRATPHLIGRRNFLKLERSIKNLLHEGGHFGMIIPNPWLTNILQHNTRRFVTQNARVQEIVHFLYPVFPGVTVDTEILLLMKAEAKQNVVLVTIAETQEEFQAFQVGKGVTQIQHSQDAWRALDGGIINIFLTKADSKLASKIASKGVAAESLLEINVGIKPYQVGKGTPPQSEKVVEDRTFDSVKKLDKSYRLYLRGSDIARYSIMPLEARFIKFGPWLAEPRPSADFDAPVKIFMRQTGDSLVAALDEQKYLCLNNLHVLVPIAKKMDARYMLGILNSKLLNWYYQSLNPEVGEALAEVKRTNVAALPIRIIDFSNAKDRRDHDSLAALATKILEAKQKHILPVFVKAIAHAKRSPCNLAHYLQKDFAAAVQADILIDDVQQTGFVHEITVKPDGSNLTLIASVSEKADGEPRALPVLRMAFKDDALRQFIYACWRQFLGEHARQRKWTKGRKPEPVFPLLVNTLEPLVYFSPAAADNLRAVRDLMKSVAGEAGSADLAALEAEITKLDGEIDQRVYDLYGLTDEERAFVEDAV
jgi:hypothetical protein